MRLAYYAGVSTAAAAACLVKAFHQRPNFYSATVYLSHSNACLLILTNLLLVIACTLIFALQRVFYGPLRPIEVEQLSEKAWYAVLDTLLAMPSFREDVGGWLLIMFVLLLTAKVWAWIGEGRVDILEQQPPANPLLFHARLSTSLALSVFFDIYMLSFCVASIIADPRPGMMVIFTFEFAIQLVFSIFTFLRYALTVAEIRLTKLQTRQAIEVRKEEIRAEREAARRAMAESNEPSADQNNTALAPEEPIDVDENEVDVPGWEDKRRYLFALELLTDFIKLMIYITFFAVSVTFSGLPMHIMRDVYMTFASFSKRLSDYMAYRKATSDMNSRYPDATTEEIRDDACIVCREPMAAWSQPDAPDQAPAGDQPAARPQRRDEGLRAKKLPCGHILHLRCLKAWLERQQVCPTCRRPVISPTNTGQGIAAGAPNGQPDAANQQAGHHQHRPRFFNLGPIRVALGHRPDANAQNLINQAANPRNADRAAQQAPHQAGPNHLGLENPYREPTPPAPRLPSSRSSRSRHRSPASINVVMMQLEQRIMQEAHNLGISQQQLAVLRQMEAEVARLRTQQVTVGPTTSTSGLTRVELPQPSTSNEPVTLGEQLAQAAAAPIQPPTLLRGSRARQFGPGHETLPAGLVLPEGWTAMPLRAVPNTLAQLPQQLQFGVPNPNLATRENPLRPFAGAQAVVQAARAPNAERLGSGTGSGLMPEDHPTQAVPTNGNGSPLFVATQPSAGDSNEGSSQVGHSTTDSVNPTNAAQEGLTETSAAPHVQRHESANHNSPSLQQLDNTTNRGSETLRNDIPAQQENQNSASADPGQWGLPDTERALQSGDQSAGSSRQNGSDAPRAPSANWGFAESEKALQHPELTASAVSQHQEGSKAPGAPSDSWGFAESEQALQPREQRPSEPSPAPEPSERDSAAPSGTFGFAESEAALDGTTNSSQPKIPASPAPPQDKGKARAVEVEDVADEET